MTSLLNKIKDKALEQVQRLDEETLRKETRKLIESARKSLPGEKDSPTYILADRGLSVLEHHEEAIGQAGPLGITALVAELGASREDEAAFILLRSSSGWAALGAAVDAATEADAQGERDREAAKAAALDLVKSIGAAAAKAVLPLFLGIVGI